MVAIKCCIGKNSKKQEEEPVEAAIEEKPEETTGEVVAEESPKAAETAEDEGTKPEDVQVEGETAVEETTTEEKKE